MLIKNTDSPGCSKDFFFSLLHKRAEKLPSSVHLFVLQVTNIPGVKIFQCCNAITFVNVHYLKRKVLEEVRAALCSSTPASLSGPECSPLPHSPLELDPAYVFQIEMVKVPLTEEEIYTLFSQNEEGAQRRRICRCYCNCDDPEPSPRVRDTSSFLLHFIKKCTSRVVILKLFICLFICIIALGLRCCEQTFSSCSKRLLSSAQASRCSDFFCCGTQTPVFLPGESHRQRSLAGYSPWDRKCWTRLSN